jgi:hypothetical protein
MLQILGQVTSRSLEEVTVPDLFGVSPSESTWGASLQRIRQQPAFLSVREFKRGCISHILD